jgi:hypothetical protein
MRLKNHGTRHGIEKIHPTNRVARDHCSSNPVPSRWRHGTYRNFFTVIRNLLYMSGGKYGQFVNRTVFCRNLYYTLLEQISYECEKSRHTARSRHGIEEIFLTNHTARVHFSSNQNARTRHLTVTARHVRTVTFSQSYKICSIGLDARKQWEVIPMLRYVVPCTCCKSVLHTKTALWVARTQSTNTSKRLTRAILNKGIMYRVVFINPWNKTY